MQAPYAERMSVVQRSSVAAARTSRAACRSSRVSSAWSTHSSRSSTCCRTTRSATPGNPALKLPVLKLEDGSWFGQLNACRALARRVDRRPAIVWPEQLAGRNAPTHRSSCSRAWQRGESDHRRALAFCSRRSRDEGTRQPGGQRRLLDEHLDAALSELPAGRDLSFFETTLFCFITHLQFREVMQIDRHQNLLSFCAKFGDREWLGRLNIGSIDRRHGAIGVSRCERYLRDPELHRAHYTRAVPVEGYRRATGAGRKPVRAVGRSALCRAAGVLEGIGRSRATGDRAGRGIGRHGADARCGAWRRRWIRAGPRRARARPDGWRCRRRPVRAQARTPRPRNRRRAGRPLPVRTGTARDGCHLW